MPPTPSAAAELAVPDRAEQERILLDLQQIFAKVCKIVLIYAIMVWNNTTLCWSRALHAETGKKGQGQLQQVQDAIRQQMQKRLHSAELQLGHAAALTGSLDPYKVLARGYTMVTAANGTILNADDLQPEKINLCSQRFPPCKVQGGSGGGDQ